MRKFLFFLIIILLVVGALYKYSADRLTDPGHRSEPEQYTAAETPKLDPNDVRILSALDEEYTRLVRAVVPSVVSVTTSRYVQMAPSRAFPFLDFYGGQGGGRRAVPGLGSGVIVSEEGHILTNYHVVKDVDEVKVVLNGGSAVDANFIGGDEALDLAVLKVDAGKLTPLSFGDSDSVAVGQLVFAVGSPFGLEETVTSGIISAIGRPAMSDMGSEFLQTNADINPGNSGGPLINLRGEIVGINTMIFSQSGGSVGIGFAIPANAARRAMESILEKGRVTRGYLGIGMQDLTPELAREFQVKRGALIAGVAADSPADKAGLAQGDVITKVDGRQVEGPSELRRAILRVDVGETVPVTYVRDGKSETVEVTIQEAPMAYFAGGGVGSWVQPRTRGPVTGGGGVLGGVEVVEIPSQHRRGLPPEVRGVMVARVLPGSEAANVLRPGDIIEEIDRKPVESVEEFAELAGAGSGSKRLLAIIRGRTRSFVVIP